MNRVSHLGADLVDVLGLVRLGRYNVLVAVEIVVVEVVARQIDAAPECLPEPVLTLGDVLLQIGLESLPGGEILSGLLLDAQEIPPEVAVADYILAEGIAAGCVFQNPVKGFLQGDGRLAFQTYAQYAAADGDQHTDGTALFHCQTVEGFHLFIRLLREAEALPDILRTGQAPCQNTGGIAVPGSRSIGQQLESLLTMPGIAFVFIIDILECFLHIVTEKLSHF